MIKDERPMRDVIIPSENRMYESDSHHPVYINIKNM